MKLTGFFIFILFPILLYAQPKAPLKWKNISMEEMTMDTYDYEPDAPAVILYDYGQQYFDINAGGQYLFLFRERHVRIKILNEAGIKYAKIKIPFYDIHCEKFFKENNITINARTYNLDKSGKIVSSKLKLKELNYRDSIGCLRIVEFTMPDVKVGSVIEYKYKVPTLEMIYPKSWYFQRDIPVLYSEFRISVPHDFEYVVSPKNVDEFAKQEVAYYSKTLQVRGYDKYYNKYYNGNIDLSGRLMIFAMKNIPSFSCRKFIYNRNDYVPKLNIHLQRIQQRNQTLAWEIISYPLMITTNDFYYTKTPEQRRMIPYPAGYVIMTDSWEEINTKMLKHHRFGMPMTLPWRDEGTLDSITLRSKPEKEKMLDIYNFIRKEITWDSSYVIYADRVFSPFMGKMWTRMTGKFVNEKSVRKPFESRKGTNVEINFILIHFLKRMGLEADPVLISTHEHGAIDTNIHDVDQFNHVIVRTRIDNEYLFLDATDSLRPYNFVKKNCLDANGFLISENGHEWVRVNNKDLTGNTISTEINIDENFNMSGTVKNNLTGYNALSVRRKLLAKATETDNLIQTGLNNIQISNMGFENLDNIEAPLIIKSDIKKSGNQNSIELLPEIEVKFNETDFLDGFRLCSLEFDYPFEYQYTIRIRFPESCSVSYPKDMQLKMFGNQVLFNYSIKKTSNTEIVLHIDYAIKQNRFPADAYSMFSDFIDRLYSKLNGKIIISKN